MCTLTVSSQARGRHGAAKLRVRKSINSGIFESYLWTQCAPHKDYNRARTERKVYGAGRLGAEITFRCLICLHHLVDLIISRGGLCLSLSICLFILLSPSLAPSLSLSLFLLGCISQELVRLGCPTMNAPRFWALTALSYPAFAVSG